MKKSFYLSLLIFISCNSHVKWTKSDKEALYDNGGYSDSVRKIDSAAFVNFINKIIK